MPFPSHIAELYKHLLVNDTKSGVTTHVREWLLHTSEAELAILSINLRTLMSGAKIFSIGFDWLRGYIAINGLDSTFP